MPVADHYEGHGVQGMGRVRSVCCCIKHGFGIAVVGCNKGYAAHFLYFENEFTDAPVNRFAGRNRGWKNSGMAYHVAVCKVQDDQVIVFF